MLNKTQDLTAFKRYSGFVRLGKYQLVVVSDERTKLKIAAGQFCYEETFDSTNADDKKKMEELLDWLRHNDFVEIEDTVSPDTFFMK